MNDIDNIFETLRYPAIYYWEEQDSSGRVWYCAQYPDGHVEKMVYWVWLVEDAEVKKCRLVPLCRPAKIDHRG